MVLLFWGMTLTLLGKLLIGVAVIRAHKDLITEHKIDKVVERSFRQERVITIVGLSMIVVGYVIELVHFGIL